MTPVTSEAVHSVGYDPSARVLRVFSVERRAIPTAPLLDLLRLTPAELTRRLARPEPLL